MYIPARSGDIIDVDAKDLDFLQSMLYGTQGHAIVYAYSKNELPSIEPFKTWKALHQGNIETDDVSSWQKGIAACNYFTLINSTKKVFTIGSGGITIKDRMTHLEIKEVVTLLHKEYHCTIFPYFWTSKNLKIEHKNTWYEGTRLMPDDDAVIICPDKVKNNLSKKQRKLLKKNSDLVSTVGKWDAECETLYLHWLSSFDDPDFLSYWCLQHLLRTEPSLEIFKIYHKEKLLFGTILFNLAYVVGYSSFRDMSEEYSDRSIGRYEPLLVPVIYNKPYNIGGGEGKGHEYKKLFFENVRLT